MRQKQPILQSTKRTVSAREKFSFGVRPGADVSSALICENNGAERHFHDARNPNYTSACSADRNL